MGISSVTKRQFGAILEGLDAGEAGEDAASVGGATAKSAAEEASEVIQSSSFLYLRVLKYC